MRITVDIPDHLIAEIEDRRPNATWQQLITDALWFAISQADAEHADEQPPPDHPVEHPADDYNPHTTPEDSWLNSHRQAHERQRDRLSRSPEST